MADPIEQASIDLRANGLHEIAGQAIAPRVIHVEKAKAGIEPECRDSKAGFGFEEGVQVVENCVWGRVG